MKKELLMESEEDLQVGKPVEVRCKLSRERIVISDEHESREKAVARNFMLQVENMEYTTL